MSDRSSVPSRILGACATRLGLGDSLENINTTTLDDGAFCYVVQAHLHFELHKDSTAVPDGVTIIAPIAGPGRWVEATGGAGAQGAQGFQGSQGFQGGAGSGAQGAQGFQGNQGSQGFQGQAVTGAQGATGAQGNQGSQGATGVQGSQGSQGSGAQPFIGEYYVNPAFSGVSTGSASAPFTSVAAAFAFAASASVVKGVVYTYDITENIVFPAIGDWELAGIPQTGVAGITITGNVDVSTSANARRALSNLTITGNVSGNNTGTASRLRLLGTNVAGTLTLTGSTSNFWRLTCFGKSNAGPNGVGGTVTGAVAVAGAFYFSFYLFGADITWTIPENPQANNCIFSGDFNCSAGAITNSTIVIYSCAFLKANTAFNQTGGGQLAVVMDSASGGQCFQFGVVTSGLVTFNTNFNGYGTRADAVTDNVGATRLAFAYPRSMLVVTATLTLMTPGTLGSAVLNAIYTDLTGVVRTKAVTPALNIAGSAGDEVQGQLAFSQLGGSTTDIEWSVTGITTPGALVYSVGVSVRPGQ